MDTRKKYTPLTLGIWTAEAIRGNVIRGNIIIVSNSSLTIGADAILEDVVLFAPCIRFESGFHGAL